MRSERYIPIVRRTLSADGSILQKIVGKETIKVDVTVNKETLNGLYVLGGMITGGILIHAFVRKF